MSTDLEGYTKIENGSSSSSSFCSNELIPSPARNNGHYAGLPKTANNPNQPVEKGSTRQESFGPWKTATLAFLSGIVIATLGADLVIVRQQQQQPPPGEKMGARLAVKHAAASSSLTDNSAPQRAVKNRRRRMKKNDDDDDDDDAVTFDCDDGFYEKRTLKLAYERPMAALFPKYEPKFETSSVTMVDGEAYAICDSSWSIYKFGLDLQPRGPLNIRFGDPNREEDIDSDYEAIFHDDGTFYVVRESIEDEDSGTYHSIIEEIVLDPPTASLEEQGSESYSIQRQCSTEFEFDSDNKGFEGLVVVRDLSNEVVLLGLCEGNHCSKKYDDDRGNGRIVKMKRSVTVQGDECIWETMGTLDIPKSAYFADYSAMSIDKDGFIAITSQEDSQLWVGRLLGKDDKSGLWDVENLAFDQMGEIFDFPKDNDCEKIYCNIEGIHWLDDGTLLAASDKMKKQGKQHFRCREHDQSIHVFVLP